VPELLVFQYAEYSTSVYSDLSHLPHHNLQVKADLPHFLQAQDIAYEKGMDLVKIAPQAKPPVCKIMDYGKYKFELNKREKENRKNQKVINIKEVQLSPSIDTNDFNTKCNHAIKFLKKGDKVKVIVRFRGREVSHSQIGYTLLERFAEQAKEAGTVEKPAKLEGRNMTMFLAPLS
jgi:translation initiation factor IF-3